MILPTIFPPWPVLLILAANAIWVKWKIKKWWKGEKIAVLGERGIGKTSLINFLSTGSLPEFLSTTIDPFKFKGRKFKLEDFELKLQEGWDVSGGEYSSWKTVFDDANTVIYLFRADKVIQNDESTSKNIKSHITKMEEWLLNNGNKQIVLVGNYLDKLNDYHKFHDKSSCGTYYDNFKEIELISNSIIKLGGEKKTKFVLGTMKDETGTQKLAYDIFKTKF